jgi:hypothetical protein
MCLKAIERSNTKIYAFRIEKFKKENFVSSLGFPFSSAHTVFSTCNDWGCYVGFWTATGLVEQILTKDPILKISDKMLFESMKIQCIFFRQIEKLQIHL